MGGCRLWIFEVSRGLLFYSSSEGFHRTRMYLGRKTPLFSEEKKRRRAQFSGHDVVQLLGWH